MLSSPCCGSASTCRITTASGRVDRHVSGLISISRAGVSPVLDSLTNWSSPLLRSLPARAGLSTCPRRGGANPFFSPHHAETF